MDERLKRVIEECAHASHAGTRDFASVVAALLEVGVEAYHVDYRARCTTYYAEQQSHRVELPAPDVVIPGQLATEALEAAIRGSQRGEVRYPAFLQRSMSAGCMGYIAFLHGRQVTYMGRDGSQHVERFPS